MFADDIALVSDMVVGLQKQLNILCQFCQTCKISVNITKSNILVLNRGGRLAASEKWYYLLGLAQIICFHLFQIHFLFWMTFLRDEKSNLTLNFAILVLEY